MPRKGVPYGGGICSLKERIAEIWDKLGEKLHSINGVQGDGQGNVQIESGDDAIVINSNQIGHKIEVSLDKSKLPAAPVSSVNGQTGAVVLNAGDIPTDGNANVQTDIDVGKAGLQNCIADINTEREARQEADSAETSARESADTALGARIDALGSASGKDVGTASGQVPILGAGGKLPNSVIPALAISQYLGVVASVGALTGLTGQKGDYAVVSGTSATSGTYIISDNDGSSASDWVRISGPTDITPGDGIVVSGSVVGLASSGVTAGSKGSAVQIPTVTVDQYGRVTALRGTTVYPPTTAGTSGQVWHSDGSGSGAWETPDTAPTASSSKLVTSGGVKTAIDVEASARSSADSALQSAIDAEASARASAISAEASARQKADDALQTKIDAVQAGIPGAAATAVSNNPTVARLAADVPTKLDKITGGSIKRAYTHTGSVQDDTPAVNGTDADSIGLRDANGRMQAADPAAGATDKTLVTANWVSQSGNDAPNNLIHKTGNETKTGQLTIGNTLIMYNPTWGTAPITVYKKNFDSLTPPTEFENIIGGFKIKDVNDRTVWSVYAYRDTNGRDILSVEGKAYDNSSAYFHFEVGPNGFRKITTNFDKPSNW